MRKSTDGCNRIRQGFRILHRDLLIKGGESGLRIIYLPQKPLNYIVNLVETAAKVARGARIYFVRVGFDRDSLFILPLFYCIHQ